jgi:hypothetical protein
MARCTETYSLHFELAEKVWVGAVLAFDDAQVKLHKSRLDPTCPGSG